MSHARRADKLLIKPAAGARPAPPHTRGQIIPKAHTKRPVTRRVTRGTTTTRPANAPDRHPRRVSQSPELGRGMDQGERVQESCPVVRRGRAVLLGGAGTHADLAPEVGACEEPSAEQHEP